MEFQRNLMYRWTSLNLLVDGVIMGSAGTLCQILRIDANITGKSALSMKKRTNLITNNVCGSIESKILE